MIHRRNNILKAKTNGDPDFGTAYLVIACPTGAVASAASGGTTATVDAGHGFAAGDKMLILSTGSGTFVAEAVSSVTPTTILWSSATPTIAKGDLLVNLGPDSSSSSTPAYDASPMYIYSDADGDDVVTNSKVTCDIRGNYEYWTGGDGRNWELIADSSGVIAGVVPGWSGVSGRFNICDYGATGDGSTDNALRINTTINAANGGVVWIPGGPLSSYVCDSAIIPTANTKLLGDPDATLLKGWSVATNGVGDGFIYNENAASASDDNIEIGGFRIDLEAPKAGKAGDIIQLWSDNLYIHDLRIVDFGATGTGGRAIVYRGDNTRITNVHATSDLDETGNGGILCFGGTGHVVADCICRAGDDAFGAWVPTSGSWGNIDLAEYALSNCRGESNAARLFFCGSGVGAFSGSVRDVTVNNLTGFGDNGLVHVNIPHASSTGTVKNVRISECVADPVKNDEANYSIFVNDAADNDLVEGVHISHCSFRVTGNAAAPNASHPVQFSNVNRCSIKDCDIDATSQTAAQLGVIDAEDCQDIEVCGNTIRCSTTNPTAGTFGVIQFGKGTNEVSGGMICNNTILDLPTLSTPTTAAGIMLLEATDVVVNGNRIKLGSGKTATTAILDQGGTVEGNNVVVGNNLIDFWDAPAIETLNEGDTVYENNLGFNPAGVETYVADTTPAQGDVPLRARTCVVTTGTEDDSVTMPEAFHGRIVTVVNNSGSTDLQVFPASGDNLGDGVDNPMFIAGVGAVTWRALNAIQWVVVGGTAKSTSA